MIKINWSVMLPNEAEPGRAALEDQYGKEALNDPDIFGVVKNTASIKTTQHWIRSGVICPDRTLALSQQCANLKDALYM